MEQTLSPEAATAICTHMNEDHADSVAAYARAYGKIENVRAATIRRLDGVAMELDVESGGEQLTARIVFDHVLQNTDDARMTLISMAQHAARMQETHSDGAPATAVND